MGWDGAGWHEVGWDTVLVGWYTVLVGWDGVGTNGMGWDTWDGKHGARCDGIGQHPRCLIV